MKSVCITGATSSLGVALVGLCVREGVPVVALVRKNSAKTARLPSSPLIDVRECELDQLATFPVAALRCDVFFHLAWAGTDRQQRDDARCQAENIAHTLDAVGLALRLGCNTFVGVGSQAEYGRREGAVPPSAPVHPESAYGVCKYAAGQLAQNLCARSGMRFAWARVFSAYGPWDHADTLIMHCIASLLRGEKPALTACEQRWDYLHIQDVGRALFLIGEKGRDGSAYNIGSGQARPLRDYVEIVRDAIDPSLPLGLGEVPYAPGQVMHLCADIASLSADTGFLPAISFDEGIRQTIAWYQGATR